MISDWNNGGVSFGDWMRQRRQALDLTQAALAQLVGCAVITIKKIEQDERHPSLQVAQLLADHLAVPAPARDAFIRMARGQIAPSSASPQEAVLPPPFLQRGAHPSNPDQPLFVAASASWFGSRLTWKWPAPETGMPCSSLATPGAVKPRSWPSSPAARREPTPT